MTAQNTPTHSPGPLASLLRVLRTLVLSSYVALAGMTAVTVALLAPGGAAPKNVLYVWGCVYGACFTLVATAVVAGRLHNTHAGRPVALWSYYLALAVLLLLLPALGLYAALLHLPFLTS